MIPITTQGTFLHGASHMHVHVLVVAGYYGFMPRHTIVAGYCGFTDVRVSIHPPSVRLFFISG